jgi:peptide deformylase
VSSLIRHDDPLLYTKQPIFDFEAPPIDTQELAGTLRTALSELGGVGLAAPQIGLPYRAFAIKTNPVAVIFNPIIVATGDETNELEEGCLSLKGFTAKVSRYNSLRLRFTTPEGVTMTERYQGMTARIIQHETDHLNGVLFWHHVSKLKQALALKKAAKRGFKYNLTTLNMASKEIAA